MGMSRDLRNDVDREADSGRETTGAELGGDALEAKDGTGLRAVLASDFNVWQAVGGVRGLTETALPSLIFIAVLVATGQLLASVLAPLAVAAIAIIVRLAQRIDVVPALGGVLGVAVSAIWAWRSGEASNYFAMGLYTNGAYLAGMLVSLAVGWPALGLLIGFTRGDAAGWRTDPAQRAAKRAYTRITWIWVCLFAFRILVQLPLFLSDATTLLGIARILMGPLLFALTAWLTWLIVRTLPPVEATAQLR